MPLVPIIILAIVFIVISIVKMALAGSLSRGKAENKQSTDSFPYQPKNVVSAAERSFLRTAKRGQNVGTSFWGCPGYPKCRGIIQA